MSEQVSFRHAVLLKIITSLLLNVHGKIWVCEKWQGFRVITWGSPGFQPSHGVSHDSSFCLLLVHIYDTGRINTLLSLLHFLLLVSVRSHAALKTWGVKGSLCSSSSAQMISEGKQHDYHIYVENPDFYHHAKGSVWQMESHVLAHLNFVNHYYCYTSRHAKRSNSLEGKLHVKPINMWRTLTRVSTLYPSFSLPKNPTDSHVQPKLWLNTQIYLLLLHLLWTYVSHSLNH